MANILWVLINTPSYMLKSEKSHKTNKIRSVYPNQALLMNEDRTETSAKFNFIQPVSKRVGQVERANASCKMITN